MIIIEYWAYCDECGEAQPMVDSPLPKSKHQALRQAIASGWGTKENKLLCPQCNQS